MIIPQLSVRLELSKDCRESICLHLGLVRFLRVFVNKIFEHFMKFWNHFEAFIEKLVTFARSFRKNLKEFIKLLAIQTTNCRLCDFLNHQAIKFNKPEKKCISLSLHHVDTLQAY